MDIWVVVSGKERKFLKERECCVYKKGERKRELYIVQGVDEEQTVRLVKKFCMIDN